MPSIDGGLHVVAEEVFAVSAFLLPSMATNSAPNRLLARHSRLKSLKRGLKAARLSRRKSAMVLKSGVTPGSSHFSSKLRPASASRRRLERMRCR
jgi:cob(I)alamin adenosyltransferase